MTTDNASESSESPASAAGSSSGRSMPGSSRGRSSSRSRSGSGSGSAATAVMSNGSFIVLLILSLILLAQTIGQMQLQARNTALLENQLAQQTQAFTEATNVRTQLESIAGETAILADQGNVNAIRIRASLQEQGINISAPKN